MVVGPFEQEVEGTGIASVVVKVKGEHPATPGFSTYLKLTYDASNKYDFSILTTVSAMRIFLSFFLSWVSKTQPNHWTKRRAST